MRFRRSAGQVRGIDKTVDDVLTQIAAVQATRGKVAPMVARLMRRG